MNPSWSPELPPVEVGSGGEEEVRVVARRVGLKRRDVGFDGEVRSFQRYSQSYLSLPNESIVTQVLEHSLLSAAQVLSRVFLTSWHQINVRWRSVENNHSSKLHGREHEYETQDLD